MPSILRGGIVDQIEKGIGLELAATAGTSEHTQRTRITLPTRSPSPFSPSPCIEKKLLQPQPRPRSTRIQQKTTGGQ